MENLKTKMQRRIGSKLVAEREKIVKSCTQLREIANETHDGLLAPIEAELHNASALVSFIGQVKAGKTSLLNAFIGKTDFLPSDVNPWTSVVTRLHFGRLNKPQSGAHFSFFDDAQWQKFAHRGGRLAEIARDIPGATTESRKSAPKLRACKNAPKFV